MLSDLEQTVLSHIDDEELVRWVQELTRIPSVWRPQSGEGEAAAAAWVAERCRELGLETQVEWVVPNRPNVVVRHRMGAGSTLLFEGHTDVVTPGDPVAWSDPPFSGVLRDGRIYGRGANDMKGGLVCALAALRAIVRSGVELRGSLMLAAVCDEEGDMIGIKHFVEAGWADDVSAAIICEPEENHLCVSQKGVVWLRILLHGIMAHGAMPLTGASTIPALAEFLTLVRELELRLIEELGSDEYLGQPSLTPTIVRTPAPGYGEPQKNVIPAASEVVLDCRLVPNQDADVLVKEIDGLLRSTVAADDRLRYTLNVIEVRHPTFTDRTHPLVTALDRAYRDVTGRPAIYGGVPGSTDGTILYARRRIPIVTCGPGDIHLPHQVDEWVGVEDLTVAARLYALAAVRYLGVAGRR